MVMNSNAPPSISSLASAPLPAPTTSLSGNSLFNTRAISWRTTLEPSTTSTLGAVPTDRLLKLPVIPFHPRVGRHSLPAPCRRPLRAPGHLVSACCTMPANLALQRRCWREPAHASGCCAQLPGTDQACTEPAEHGRRHRDRAQQPQRQRIHLQLACVNLSQ